MELADDTFIVTSVPRLAVVVADCRRWREWWPDMQVSVYLDDMPEALHWSVAGDLVGSVRIRIEEVPEGVVLHYQLLADPTAPASQTRARSHSDSPQGRRVAQRLRRLQTLHWKRVVWSLKEELERDERTGRR